MNFDCHSNVLEALLLKLSAEKQAVKHFRATPLRLLLRTNEEQSSAAQQSQSPDDRRKRDVLRIVPCGVNRTYVENLLLARVVESLIDEGKNTQNREQNP